MKCYTYAYLREDRTPYYIGKGTGKRATAKHLRSNNKFVPVPSDPQRILILKHFENEDDAHRHEEYMISVFGREIDGGILLNLCLGGKSRAIYKDDEERRIANNKRQLSYYYNRPERREYVKKWREENRERCRERKNELCRENYKKDPEHYKAKRKKYYERNKEQEKEKARKRYDPEKRRQYYLKNKK